MKISIGSKFSSRTDIPVTSGREVVLEEGPFEIWPCRYISQHHGRASYTSRKSKLVTPWFGVEAALVLAQGAMRVDGLKVILSKGPAWILTHQVNMAQPLGPGPCRTCGRPDVDIPYPSIRRVELFRDGIPMLAECCLEVVVLYVPSGHGGSNRTGNDEGRLDVMKS